MHMSALRPRSLHWSGPQTWMPRSAAVAAVEHSPGSGVRARLLWFEQPRYVRVGSSGPAAVAAAVAEPTALDQASGPGSH